ncbi:MAG: urease accessory protein UreE [Lachnospiraceae bacterium]|nr:urease accessory protein UreE [Lachnospiraceae bacterium]
MVVDTIITGVDIEHTDKQIVKVVFEWFELEKRRISKIAGDGTEFGICIDAVKRDGDVLAETEDHIYVVAVAPCHLIKITVHSMEEMGRLCFELGNRHLPLQMNEAEVRVPFDEPTYACLQKLGFGAEEVTEPFTDFIVCKAHGHNPHHA